MSAIASTEDGADRVSVLLPIPLARSYDYHVPSELVVSPGDFVRVPLGKRTLVGIVWGVGSAAIDVDRIKPIEAKVEAPPLPKVMLRFVEWVADYTVSPLGAVLKMVMSIPGAFAPERDKLGYAVGSVPNSLRITPARARILQLAAEAPASPAADLARAAAVGPSVIKGLVEAGALVPVPVRKKPELLMDLARPAFRLSEAQNQAAADLRQRVGGGFSVVVLDGVPGAGKTEVYFEAMAESLKQGRQVLVLLPEIALGAQWLARFRNRFGAPAGQWHSDLPPGYRRRVWRSAARGEMPVVVGARSALFLPFPNLGLIVVDEEHDPSYKQEEGVIYHARDMAVVRSRLAGIPTVLVSATPSLETVLNVQSNRYDVVRLPKRHGGGSLADVEIVDLRRDKPKRGSWLAPSLRTALAETLEEGNQALIFLNRRGYAPLTVCRDCGHRMRCPSCTAWLVYHRSRDRLQCHHCGFNRFPPASCPECQAVDSLSACGPGVERIAEEIVQAYPHARTVMATSDLVASARAAEDLVRRVEAREVDLIVGTQIVAKGYHFPHLTLVGVIDADLGLSGGDLRAAERTFQLLYQVAGRAGRGTATGRVMLQTYRPTHPVIEAIASRDRDRFFREETKARERAGMPPFGRLAAVIVSGRDIVQVDAAAMALSRAAPAHAGVRVLGPAPAPLALLRGRYRRRLLLIARKQVPVSRLLRAWLVAVPVPSAVRVQVDVDPQNFL